MTGREPFLQRVQAALHVLSALLQRGQALHALHEQDTVRRTGHAAARRRGAVGPGLQLFLQAGEAFGGLHEQVLPAVTGREPFLQRVQAALQRPAHVFQPVEARVLLRQREWAILPGQGRQTQARVADGGRGGVEPGFPVPQRRLFRRGGRRGALRRLFPGKGRQAVHHRGLRLRSAGRGVFHRQGQRPGGRNIPVRQPGAFFDKVRQFDDLVVIGRYGHARLSCGLGV